MKEELVIYKYIVTIPGQSITWYGNAPINYKTESGFPSFAHGFVYESHIPKDCGAEDLINFLNGTVTEKFTEHKIAFLLKGCWTPYIEKSLPTVVDVVSAFINGEYNND